MNKTSLKLGAAATLAMALSACAITGNETVDAGLTGAAGGAVAGEVLAEDPVAGAAIGAGAAVIADEVTDDDPDSE